jgi:hypothetical protein
MKKTISDKLLTKKLKLASDKLRVLGESDLQNVDGGTAPSITPKRPN